MYDELINDISYGTIYITVRGYNGNIKVTGNNLEKITEELLKVKSNDKTIVIPIREILYYEC